MTDPYPDSTKPDEAEASHTLPLHDRGQARKNAFLPGPIGAALALAWLGTFPAALLEAKDQATGPGELLVDDLHSAFGKHGVRAVHAKGIIAEGHFDPSTQARTISNAALFRKGTPILVRFSNFTGYPDIPDDDPNANPRGMAIRFGPAEAPVLDVVTHNFDGFPVRTAAEFGELLRAIGDSPAGTAAPSPLDTFLTGHPRAKAFLTTQHPAPISYATTSYFGVNAVTFTGAGKRTMTVRYRFVPVGGEAYFGAGYHSGLTSNYLRPEIEKRLSAGPIRFDWYAQVAQPGDLIDDPSIAWPANRPLIKLGTITIERLTPNTPEEDRALMFSPTRMPSGIEPADPMLAIRASAYPVSFRQRQISRDSEKAAGTEVSTRAPDR